MSIEQFKVHVRSMREEYEKSGHFGEKVILLAFEELLDTDKKEEEEIEHAETGEKSYVTPETDPIIIGSEGGIPEGSSDGEGHGAGSGSEDYPS